MIKTNPGYDALKAAGYSPLQAKAIVRGAARGEQDSKDAIAKAMKELAE